MKTRSNQREEAEEQRDMTNETFKEGSVHRNSRECNVKDGSCEQPTTNQITNKQTD